MSVSSAYGGSAAKRFVDETSQEVTVKNFPPCRIISLSPSVTEILFEIGLADNIVGVTTYCNYPAAAAKKAKVGEYAKLNTELIVSLKPELVIISAEGDILGDIDELVRLGIPVYAVTTMNLTDLLTTIKDIGIVTGRENAANALAGRVRDEIDAVRAALMGAKKKTVFCAVGTRPLIGAGPNTLIGDIIKLCGGQNIIGADAPNYPVFSLEELYARDPDVILIASMGTEATRGDKKYDRFAKLKASKSGNIIEINADLLCRPSYRLTTAMKELARILHPDRFPKKASQR